MQDMLVYVIVGAAMLYLIRTFWKAATDQKGGCGSCGSNSSCAAEKQKGSELIQINLQNLNGKP